MCTLYILYGWPSCSHLKFHYYLQSITSLICHHCPITRLFSLCILWPPVMCHQQFIRLNSVEQSRFTHQFEDVRSQRPLLCVFGIKKSYFCSPVPSNVKCRYCRRENIKFQMKYLIWIITVECCWF